MPKIGTNAFSSVFMLNYLEIKEFGMIASKGSPLSEADCCKLQLN